MFFCNPDDEELTNEASIFHLDCFIDSSAMYTHRHPSYEERVQCRHAALRMLGPKRETRITIVFPWDVDWQRLNVFAVILPNPRSVEQQR